MGVLDREDADVGDEGPAQSISVIFLIFSVQDWLEDQTVRAVEIE